MTAADLVDFAPVPNVETPHDLLVPSTSKLSALPASLQVPVRQRFRTVRSALRRDLSPFGLYASREVIFIHIAKNAGSAVNGVVYPDFKPSVSTKANAHHTAQYLRRLDRDRFDRYAKFGILRRPSDRLRSAFNYLRSDSPFEVDRAFATRSLADFADFDDFCDRVDEDRMAELMTWPHFQPQISYICDRSGRILVDYLLTVDELVSGLAELSDRLSLPFGTLPERSTPPRRDARADDIALAFYGSDVAIYDEVVSQAGSLTVVRPHR